MSLPLTYEPRHLEEAKRQVAADRANGKIEMASFYDADIARNLAHLNAARERQAAYRAERKVRFTELREGFVCDRIMA